MSKEEIRPLMKRIIDIHYSKDPDYCLDALFTAIINDGWKKL